MRENNDLNNSSHPPHIDPFLDETQYTMVMHFAQLISFGVPLLGSLIVIIMWYLKKEDNEFINKAGKNIINWTLSKFIYIIFSVGLIIIPIVISVGVTSFNLSISDLNPNQVGLLSLFPILLGALILLFLFVCQLTFTIIGGIKAYKKKQWPYPLSLPFFK